MEVLFIASKDRDLFINEQIRAKEVMVIAVTNKTRTIFFISTIYCKLD